MKKAFTMIECIYVVIVLGVIAGFAIPVLSNVRDDAKVIKTTKNITTLINDFNMFYTVNGSFTKLDGDFYSLDQITNVALDLPEEEIAVFSNSILNRLKDTNGKRGGLKVDDKNCVFFTLLNDTDVRLELSDNLGKTCRKVLANQTILSTFTNYSKNHCEPYVIDKNHDVSINTDCNILTFSNNI